MRRCRPEWRSRWGSCTGDCCWFLVLLSGGLGRRRRLSGCFGVAWLRSLFNARRPFLQLALEIPNAPRQCRPQSVQVKTQLIDKHTTLARACISSAKGNREAHDSAQNQEKNVEIHWASL